MRNKKILSTVVASALAATTMAVPVMAADGGNIDVPVTTKTAVIRVQVPTKMDISVNQFEMGDGGSQIYSTPFDMINRSEIPVKISVTSTAELKATTKLVGTKADAESSKTEGEVWMAVAAETAADSYADGADTAIKDLTDENKNVTSFVQGTDADAAKGTANQTFYMDKSGTMKYKLLNSNEAAADIEYAQFYELTLQSVAGADALAALIAENDVYVAAGAAADGQDLTKEAKGTAHTYDAGEKYYTAALEATAKGDVDSSKLYVYGNGEAATDGVAAFRYIGKLSGAQETWTKDDITKVSIKYDILGVQESKYNDVKADCVYGLYNEPAPTEKAPSIPTATAKMVSGQPATFNVDLGAGDLKATGITSVTNAGTTTAIPTSAYSFKDGVLTITADRVNTLLSANLSSKKYDVIFNDKDKTVVTITLEK